MSAKTGSQIYSRNKDMVDNIGLNEGEKDVCVGGRSKQSRGHHRNMFQTNMPFGEDWLYKDRFYW